MTMWSDEEVFLASGRRDPFADLHAVAAIALDADLARVAEEAAALAERLSAGRFFVACVGQFKRG